MTALAARVLADIRRLRLVGAGDRVVVALSGGPDSVALTRLLAEALPALRAELAGVAHLHHGLRGDDADADAAFCRDLAGTLGVGCLIERADAAAYGQLHRVSVEVAGHRLRAQLFERARGHFRATVVATGHTRNDVAETFLMRAARGAGLRGLGAIRPARPGLIRPLLSVERRDLVDYLAAIGQAFREDESNRDRCVTRNRVRHDVLPVLESHLSPKIVEALARTARLADEDDRFLTRIATSIASRFVLETDGRIRLVPEGLVALPLALRRRLVLGALDRLTGNRTTSRTVDTVLESLARADTFSIGAGAGIRASRTEAGLFLERASTRRPPRPRPPRDVAARPAAGHLPVPGVVGLPGGGVIEAARVGVEAPGQRPDALEARLDAGCVPEPITVRFRRPGDRLRPLGMTGHRKLQDLFVDRKVPRRLRDDVPLVVDASGRIVWVAGHVVAEEARVTAATTSVLLLKYRR